MTMTTNELGTILSVWAHPDDETYLAGGIMAAARRNGQRVVCASATAGEHGTRDPYTWPPARLGRLRRWETAAAMAILGVDDHRFGGFTDGDLADHDGEGIRWVAGLLGDVVPDTILTFGPDGITYHPDHIAVHRWVTCVWRARGCHGRLLHAVTTKERLERFHGVYEEWDVFMTHERPAGVPRAELDMVHDLYGSDLDRKCAALRAMASQTAHWTSSLAPDVLRAMIAEETFVSASPSRSSRTGRRSRRAVEEVVGQPA